MIFCKGFYPTYIATTYILLFQRGACLELKIKAVEVLWWTKHAKLTEEAGEEEKLGKVVGGDIEEGTLIVILFTSI